ncbi:MAG: phosphate ABC transporter permease subunit PstC, partial [Paracoccaceae bacterium]|nr:phosphate ABC transporter permease subunit PstC [Paracoccaceae bacterium]
FIWNERWSPAKDIFGAAAPIFGTLVTSAVAMVIGVPISFGIAIFLTEICPKRLRRPIGVAIELLAGIPSIIYGLWGFFVLAPIMQSVVQPFLINTLGDLPIIGALFSGAPYGIGLLTAGLVLAVMILPFITSVTRDVFNTVPVMLRESAYGMGMTTWEVVRYIIIPYTRLGLVGGIMLGLGRALGETMAVTFVIGNAHKVTASLLSPATTISASIANEFAEATTGIYTASLIALGLILFLITFTVLALAKWLIGRTETF